MPPGSISSAKVAILGLGLMGGSLALALRGKCAALLGFDPDAAAVDLALQRDILDQASPVLEQVLPVADFIILAAPVRAIIQLIDILPELHPGPACVIDIGSTKVEICQKLGSLPPRFDPLGGHPMCGKELSGLANADALIFQDAVFAFTALERTSPVARRLADELAHAIGSHPLWLDASVHDRWVASSSHLPYLVAVALALATPGEVVPMIGPGFRSSSRLAGSSVQMSADIIETNRSNILSALGYFRQELDQLESYLASADSDALKELLEKGLRQYRELVR